MVVFGAIAVGWESEDVAALIRLTAGRRVIVIGRAIRCIGAVFIIAATVDIVVAPSASQAVVHRGFIAGRRWWRRRLAIGFFFGGRCLVPVDIPALPSFTRVPVLARRPLFAEGARVTGLRHLPLWLRRSTLPSWTTGTS